MKFAVLFILALLAGTFAAQFLMADPGYVVINFRGKVVEMSVPVLVFLIALTLFVAWLTVKLLRAPRKLGEAAAQYRGKRAGKRFTQGLIEIAEGNYAKGEKMLTRGATYADAPLLNYLAAARAAQLQNQDERRDNWLKLAYENEPDASSAILLTQAELQIAHEQYELAQATLRKLDDQEQGKGQAAVLLGKLYHQLQDWRQLGELLPRLTRLGKPDKPTLATWYADVYSARFHEVADYGGDVQREWQELPKAHKSNRALRNAYVRALRVTGAVNEAEAEARRMLKSDWDPALVLQYGEIATADPASQLKVAENWLSKRSDDAELLMTAGRLCMANKLWGKARSYIESGLALNDSPQGYALYGQLLTELGESSAAADAYRQGLSMAADDALALPKPTSESE
ncbi:MAG: heme biosynthesis HemY N-terminal domain-containing protein [Pseudomonadota bacterium]